MSTQQTTAKITLDLYTKNVVSVNAKQYDNQTRYIEITCVENGIVFTVDKSIMSAFIRFKKPDDNGVFNEVEITSDGKLKIELTEQMLSASGRAIADIFLLRKVFTSEEKPTNIDDIYKVNAPIISIMDFYINITPTALDHSQIESSYEFNALTNALAQIDYNNKKVVELDKTLTANEDVRKKDEAERKSNEESRINSELKRVNEEDKRQKAEDVRIVNENTRISNENTRQAQETKRQTDTTTAIDNANAAAKNANDKANDLQNKLDNHHFVLTNELEDSVSSSSTVHAPTANAVKIAYNKAISVENTVNSNKNNWNDKYTKNEIDNKFSALENNIDWKEAVATFADITKTYPNPEDGWTVNVKDTDYTYRYNGSKWVAVSANAIPKATQSVDGLLSKEDKTNYDDANSKKHTHNNKTILDKIVSDPLLLTGGTMTGRIIREAGGTWIKDRENVAVFGSRSSSNSYNPVVGQKTPNGAWTIGNLATKEDLVFNYTTDANFNGRVNNSAPIYLPAASSESGSTIITTDTISEQSVKFATSANSAIKLTSSAGSATQPIYFSDGKPVACSIPLGGTTLSIAKEINLTDSKYNENIWYPVVATVLIPRGGMYRLKCAAQLDGNCMPSWSNHTYNNGFTAILDLLTIQSGYGTTDANEIVLSYQQKFISDSKNPIGYKQLINSSKPVLWLRGGGIYQIYSEWNTKWTILTESTTITNETISPVTTSPGLVFKKKSDIYANLQGSSTYLNGYQGSIPNTANTYVLRDKNKYVNLNYINSDTAKNENVAISQVIVTNDSDNYYRKTSLAHLKTSLGLMPPEANSNNYIKVYNDYTANAGKNNEKTANDIANAGFAVGMINGATSNPLGKKAWFHIVNMGWDTRTTNSAGLWTSQLAFGTEAGTGMYYRTTNSGAQISTIGWARVLDSSCYKSYCPPISHASSAVTYGKSTSTNYGHTKLSDTYTSAVGTADSGIAPSQTALYNVYKKIPKFSLSGTTLTITTT
ncbi:MAG: hypothetical protein ACLS3X_05870 [Lachnospira pectinoschiza]|jgi:hypothetical protein